MLELVGASATLPYRLPWAGIPDPLVHHPELVTSPRIYAEEIASENGALTTLFTQRTTTLQEGLQISMIVWMYQIYAPGWSTRIYTWEWHPVNGQAVSVRDLEWGSVYAAWVHSITQGFDGSLWMNQLGDTLRGLSQDLQTETGEVYDASHFGRTSINYPVVNRAADIVIMAAQSGVPQVQVYTLSTGALIRTLNVSGPVNYIAPEENQKVYVLCDYNILCLLDYTNGNIAYVGRLPTLPGELATSFSWDVAYKRLWVYHQMPNAADGASQSHMTAYYLTPKPTNLTKPTLLAAPRQHRSIRAASRVVGDVGESIGNRIVYPAATGGASVGSIGITADGDGYMVTEVTCNNAGSAGLTVSVNI